MSLDFSPINYRLARITLKGRVRFVPQRIDTLCPLPALSLYEAYLSQKHSSHNTIYNALNSCLYFWTWADQVGINLDATLLQGEILEARQINAFSVWLKNRGSKRNGCRIDASVINSILGHVSSAIRWFIEQCVTFDCRSSEREFYLRVHQDAVKERLSNHRVKDRKTKITEDLSEEEIVQIEQFLKPQNRLDNFSKLSPAQVVRDYLIWRLVIEFGLREGEVLALRLEDCPLRYQNSIRIVRVEERGPYYIDPRGAYAPRPKTLSRELGFILTNSPIPRLINDYISKYRRRRVIKHGKAVFQPILDTPAFLILSHRHDDGRPLSLSSLLDLAATIRKDSGVEHFHWHMGRHAFFNRAYAAIVDLKEKNHEMYRDRLRDLVYWGGWESEKSLQGYINRARHERARTALCFYQAGGNEWEALT